MRLIYHCVCFVVIAFCVLRNLCPPPNYRDTLFSSRSFIILPFLFRSESIWNSFFVLFLFLLSTLLFS